MSKVKLKARKHFCDNTECPRKVFTERFDCGIKPYYRTSGVIGVDDWAFNLRTVIVDLAKRSCRSVVQRGVGYFSRVAEKQRHEIKKVSRDRYGPYAFGIKTGVPNASQVADRFHLLITRNFDRLNMANWKRVTIYDTASYIGLI